MPLFQQVGGSLTTAAALTLLAWSVRFLRKKYNRGGIPYLTEQSQRSQGRFFCTLSPAALRMLVETDPIPHLLIDVRTAEAIKDSPLPRELNLTALQIALDEIEAVLAGGSSSWPARLREKAAPPSRDYLLVFVGEGEEQPRAAAAAASSKGFNRTAILEGGLEAFSSSVLSQANLEYINRDAVAYLLGLLEEGAREPKALVIDLRRHDERSMYGKIPGTVHVPTDEIPSALRMSSRQWRDTYHCDKPAQGDPVVMQCRTNRRASWAAQIAQDAGFKKCFVYKQGVYGWKLSPAVKSYRSYEKWDPPPEPEPFQVEQADSHEARAELSRLGLL